MNNELFKKFDYYWLYFIFTIVLCFGFYLTHSSMGIDDEIMQVWITSRAILTTDRIGMEIPHFLRIWDYFPFWKEFLAVVAYSMGITLHARNFMTFVNFDNFVFDKKMAVIFACAAVSFPYFAFHLAFMEICLMSALNLVFSALAVSFLYKYLFHEKKKSYLLFVFLLLFFIISVYEIGALYFIISACFIEFTRLLFNKSKNLKSSYNILALSAGFSFIAAILNRLITFAAKNVLNISSNRFDEWLQYDLSSFNGFLLSLKQVYSSFVGNFLHTCTYDIASAVTLISYLLFILIAIFYLIKNRNVHILIFSACLMLIPFAVLLLTGNYLAYYRIYSSLGFFNAFVLLLLYSIFKNKKVMSKLVYLLIGAVIFYQSLEINKIFYTEYLKFENDRLFAYSIKQEVDKLGGKPLVLIGTRENPHLKYNYNIEAPEINTSVFNWDRYDMRVYEIFNLRPYSFMREQGFEVRAYRDVMNLDSKEEIDSFKTTLKESSPNMAVYPAETSVKDCGEFVLIKIGASLLDKDEKN